MTAGELAAGLRLAEVAVGFLGARLLLAGSLASQANKGSWETVRELLDGRFSAGNLGPEEGRLDPASPFRPAGGPPQVEPLLTLPLSAMVRLRGLWRSCGIGWETEALALFLRFLALTWSPGWSPHRALSPRSLLPVALPCPWGGLGGRGTAHRRCACVVGALYRGPFGLLWAVGLLHMALLALTASMALGRLHRPATKEASA